MAGNGNGRDYGSGPSQTSAPRQPATYLPGAQPKDPGSDMMGGMFGFGPMKDPETSGPGKSIKRQEMGSVVGRRGAGVSQITGGDQGANSLNHYGKLGLSGLSGLSGGKTDGS